MTGFRPTRAMLLAAGRGERMRPLTDTMPKPLVPVAGKSLIDRQLDRLEAFGIEQVVVNAAYLGEMLERHLAARRSPEIVISREASALETGGGVRQALPLLGEAPFFVMNSDIVLVDGPTPALGRLAAAWRNDDDILLLLHHRETATGFDGRGDFFLEADGRLRRRGEQTAAPYVFTGTQIMRPGIFAGTPEGAFSLNRLYDRCALRGVVHDGDWLHVGDPVGLAEADAYFARAIA